VTESLKKASQIHARLPPGGILIFLTGQNEIIGLCRKLEAKYGRKALDVKRNRRRPQGLRDTPDHYSDEPRIAVPTQGENRPTFPVCLSNGIIADVEPEDMELGDLQGDLAFDVDGSLADDDPEALDTDDENAADKELGIDIDEIDSMFWLEILNLPFITITYTSSDAYRTLVFPAGE
jgi:ATP-dependent RNA helicase DHX37/DHR1